MASANSELRSAISIDELVKQFDQMARRIAMLEGRASAATPSDQARLTALEAVVAPPAPAPVTQTIVLLDQGLNASEPGIYSSSADVDVGSFTTPRAGGSVVIEGQIQARAEAWDNFVGTPRRGFGTVSTPGSSAIQELPSPSSGYGAGPTVILTFRDTFSVGLGTFSAKYHMTIAGANQINLYGGWIRATWTG